MWFERWFYPGFSVFVWLVSLFGRWCCIWFWDCFGYWSRTCLGCVLICFVSHFGTCFWTIHLYRLESSCRIVLTRRKENADVIRYVGGLEIVEYKFCGPEQYWSLLNDHLVLQMQVYSMGSRKKTRLTYHININHEVEVPHSKKHSLGIVCSGEAHWRATRVSWYRAWTLKLLRFS